MKLLTVDIGNTNITFGVFQDNRITKKFKIPTKAYALKKLKQYIGKLAIDEIIISSVVPGVTKVLGKDLKALFRKAPYILGKNISVPMKSLYRNPRKLGQDRLVNAYAGSLLYGTPLIVVDFGTGITFDIVSKNNEYLGGMILPGLDTALAGLFKTTALLPKIKLKKPKEFIGRDTQSGILSGIVYGYAALTDELSERIKEKIGKRALVIGTGGNINLMSRYCRSLDRIDSDLTLEGLNLVYRSIK